MKKVHVYLEESQVTRLDRAARLKGETRAAVIRAALDQFLASEPNDEGFAQALRETFGAIPDLKVPSRDEWARGR